ncbi:MAG TPA: MATE family efflux transporter, partial [Spirochaetales bacterium]|nr:MATE family efflux transporter [Spirochaetales bacterium]
MKDLTQGNETKVIINFAIPMLIGNVFQQFYSMVDSIVVGKFVGDQALAAVGTSFPIIFLMISLIMGLTIGTSILVAQYFGAGNREKVRLAVDTGYILLFWTGLAITIIGMLITNPLLRLLAVPDDV